MKRLLPRIVELLQPLKELPYRIKLIDARPNAWIELNLGAGRYPAVFVWSDGQEIQDSIKGNEATRILRISLTCLQHSSDPNYATFGANKGIFELTDAALNILASNKKLSNVGGDEACSGMNLPIRIQSVERTEGSSFVIGDVAIIEFYRYGLDWPSTENNSTQMIP